MNTTGVKMKYRSLAVIMMIVPTALVAQDSTQKQTEQQPKTPQTRIEAALQAAAEAKIPLSLLQSKVAEGQAKHVSAERIAIAVETRLKALLRADLVLDRADVSAESSAELAVSADALEAGVSEKALVSISKSSPDERRVVAVAILADLVRLGQTSDAALTQVSAAVTSSTTLANLSAQVASQLRLGGLSSTLEAAGIIRIP
jgi:hypothetical protein